MKRIALFILTALCFLLCPACQSGLSPAPGESSANESSPLRVLIDLGITNAWAYSESDRADTIETFRSELEKHGGPKDIEFELLFFDPMQKQENDSIRDAELTRIRTEIMAGNGPDVYILASTSSAVASTIDPLFHFPNQAMDRKFFLPLDDYIKSAKYMEWDALTQVVMDAGRNEEGQQILPLSYSLPLTVFRKSEVEHDFSKTRTFYEVAESENPAPVLSTEKTTEFGTVIMDIDQLANVFTELADYSNEELAFSEAELVSLMVKLGELNQRKSNGEFDQLPDHYYTNLSVAYDGGYESFVSGMEREKELYEDMTRKEPVTYVPLYTVNGGYTASITSYAAISRGCNRPDDAFLVLDYLLSEECQRSTFYLNMCPHYAIPTHEGLFRFRTPVKYDAFSMGPGGKEFQDWRLTGENYAELCALRDNLANARFCCELDRKLVSLLEKSSILAGNREALEKEVHKAYIEMKMLLAES